MNIQQSEMEFNQRLDLTSYILDMSPIGANELLQKYEFVISNTSSDADKENIIIRDNKHTYEILAFKPIFTAAMLRIIYANDVESKAVFKDEFSGLYKAYNRCITAGSGQIKSVMEIYAFIGNVLRKNGVLEIPSSVTIEDLEQALHLFGVQEGSGDEGDIFEDNSGIEDKILDSAFDELNLDDDEVQISNNVNDPNNWTEDTINRLLHTIKLIDTFEKVTGDKIGLTNVEINNREYTIKFPETGNKELDNELEEHHIFGGSMESLVKTLDDNNFELAEYIDAFSASAISKVIKKTYNKLLSAYNTDKYSIHYLILNVKDALISTGSLISTNITFGDNGIIEVSTRSPKDSIQNRAMDKIFTSVSKPVQDMDESVVKCIVILEAIKSEEIINVDRMIKDYTGILAKIRAK